MQYNNYSSNTHQAHPASHAPQSPDEYASPYTDPSHHHSTLSYAAVTPATHFPAGSMTHQNVSSQYAYPPYPAQSPPDGDRSYYAPSSQGPAVEHYPSPSSPTNSYSSANPSSHLSPQSSRHHTHVPQQSQQQFIPTPSQTYQVYSSAGSAPSPRVRSTVEPYYRMSPNPQHVVHAPTTSTAHATGGTGGRNSTAYGRTPHPHPGTHTGTLVVAPGERYSCDLCDRSFTRLHDRRRHYETVHATSPVSHTCRFCQRGFSRADSLKRHVDNGCDDMPR